MAFLCFTTRQKYEVNPGGKYPRLGPELKPSKLKKQHDLVLVELRQVQKLKRLASSFRTRGPIDQPETEFKQRVQYLKKRAFSIEQQIMSDLRALHEAHHAEIEFLKEQFSSKSVGYQRELEAYFSQQKRYIEEVVYRYASTLVELELSESNQDVEKLLKKMLDDLGMQAEKVVWGKKSSKWEKIQSKIRNFFRCC